MNNNYYKAYALKDVCSEITVGYVGSMAQEYVEEGIPFLRSLNIKPYWLDFNDIKYISKEFNQKISKSALTEGDVVIVRTGQPGTSCVIPNGIEKLNCSDLVIARPDKNKINPHYLSFYFNSMAKSYVGNQLVGAIQQHFNIGSAKEMIINLPPLNEQENIVNVLLNINNKIALNNRINAELEAMAKTIYDYWFVQFDFPSPPNEGTQGGLPYKTSGGKMVWNEELKREIPEGWKVGCIGDYCPSSGGFAFKSEWWTNKGVSVVKIKDIQENYTINLTDLSKVDISDKKIDDKFKAKAGDVLIAMTGATIGKYAIVPKTDCPIYVNQRVGYFNLGLQPTKKLPFLINSLNQSYFREAIFTLANGAAQPNISNEQINSILLILPDSNTIQSFNNQSEPIYKKILNNQQENQQLSNLRDWLLPMLMNGQVKVGDVAKEPAVYKMEHGEMDVAAEQ